MSDPTGWVPPNEQDNGPDTPESYPNTDNTLRALGSLIDAAGYVTGMRLATDSHKEELLNNPTREALREAIDDEMDALMVLLGADASQEFRDTVRTRFMKAACQALTDLLQSQI